MGIQRVVQDLLAAVVFEAFQLQQVAQYAQDFPQRAAFAQAFYYAVERLQTAFHIDEAAGSFGERGNRQQHVAHVEQGVADERGERHHALGLFQRGHGGGSAGHVGFRLNIEQQHGLFRRGNHFGNAAAVGFQQIRTHAVGRLRQDAE